MYCTCTYNTPKTVVFFAVMLSVYMKTTNCTTQHPGDSGGELSEEPTCEQQKQFLENCTSA
jgi:hypothetical protein